MGNILVSGSTAYDYIMDYGDKFKNHINHENIHKLSVCFVIDNLKKERGGTGLNIAYNLALLGEKSILLSSVGLDYSFSDFQNEHINLDYIHTCHDLLSSSGYITNDTDGSQITAFYPGAMTRADEISPIDVKEEIKYAIVSPNKKEAMLQYLKELHQKGIHTFFDPGQAIFGMDKVDLEEAMKYANYLIVNDFEFDLFMEKVGLTKPEVISNFEKVIITLGAKGSVIIDQNGETFINVVENGNAIDPTGAGDAYRGGLLKGLKAGYDWETSGKIGSLIASISVGVFGGQNHFVTKEDFEERFKEEFGKTIDLNYYISK